MRIVVNDIAASTTGALSILKDFYGYIKEHDREHEWIFILSGPYLEETDRIKVMIKADLKRWKNRLMFDFVKGAAYFEALKPDVLFSMQNTLIRNYHGKQAVYVHQPLGFQKEKKFSFLKKEEREYAIYQYVIAKMIDASIKRADHVFVQTKWMKDAVIAKTHISEERISTALPDIELSRHAERRVFDTHQFFFPSGDILYKNHACIFEAIQELRKMGAGGFRILLTLTEQEAEAIPGYEQAKRHLQCLGRISREEVFSLYANSTLVFPSYIETFGYPLAEARAVGTMVLASDCAFSKELLDGYQNAYFFPPFEPKILAKFMYQVMRGEICLQHVNESCHLKNHSWELVTNTLLSLK